MNANNTDDTDLRRFYISNNQAHVEFHIFIICVNPRHLCHPRSFETAPLSIKRYIWLLTNLDMIISVGYRVKSYRGVQFRIWATQVLKEYLPKFLPLSLIMIYFLIRWKQTYRTMLQLGIFRLAILLVLCLFVLAVMYEASKQTQNAALISGVWAFLITFIHAKRSDKIFLHINTDSDKLICSIEYFVLSIPLIICLFLHRQWLIAIGLVFFCFGIGFIKINWKKQQKTINTRLQQYIPSGMYEWKAGMRQYLFLLVTVWVLGLCTAFFVAGIPVAMFIIGLLIVGFYATNESWQMLLSYQKNAGKLLFYKIKQHTIFYSVLNLPLIILFMIFHHELWYIPVIVFIILLSIHIYCIVLKYAFYSRDRNTVNPIFVMVGLYIGLIPLSTPALWILSVYLFLKARTNLYPYLNDYN